MNLEQIKLVATDVDGTLTDGGMYYTTSGETFKRFYVRDGLGVNLLQAAGIDVSLISSDDSPVISNRAQRLGITHCFSGIRDKIGAVESLCQTTGLAFENVAFFGDDLQDYAVMQRVGFAAAVGDAHPLVKGIASYVCRCDGGQGAFRELAEYIIEQKGLQVQDIWEQMLQDEAK